MANLPLDWMNTWAFDSDGAKPLYQQLYDYLREGILSGRLASGLRLPGTRSLAQETGLARNTITAAYEQLVAEGFLRNKPGSGFLVCDDLQVDLQRVSVASQADAIRSAALSKRGERIASGIRRGVDHLRLPLQPGEPDCSLFPVESWTALMNREMRSAKRAQLTYGDPQGEWRLRAALGDYLGACRGVKASPERILITAGAQQGLDFCARLLLDYGDQALIEDPGYTGSRGALQISGAELLALDMDDQGACLPEEADNPRLIYLTPSHQYPMGCTMSLRRRLDWLAYAQKHGAWIIEDDYDSEFRYDSRPLAAIQGLTRLSQQQVVYMGTFSKVMFPSLRLAYLVLPEHLVAAFLKLRGFCDSQPATLPQLAMAAFIEDGRFASHIRKMRQIYAARRQTTLDFAANHLAEAFTWRDSPAGMHVTLVSKKPNWGDKAISETLREQGVGARALSDYSFTSSQRGLVVGYAGHSEAQLVKALKTLERVVLS